MIKDINEHLTDEEIRQAVIRLMAEGIIRGDKFNLNKFELMYGKDKRADK